MPGKKDIVYIYHIRDSIKKIEEFSKEKIYKEFSGDDLVLSAVIRKLEIIGEASKHVSDELKKNYPAIPWQTMTDMRNFLIHGYFGVDTKTIWDTITDDIPGLKKEVLKLIKKLDKE